MESERAKGRSKTELHASQTFNYLGMKSASS